MQKQKKYHVDKFFMIMIFKHLKLEDQNRHFDLKARMPRQVGQIDL